MTLRVIGAGIGRTGTMSLKLALERLLGGPCYHMVEVFLDRITSRCGTASPRRAHQLGRVPRRLRRGGRLAGLGVLARAVDPVSRGDHRAVDPRSVVVVEVGELDDLRRLAGQSARADEDDDRDAVHGEVHARRSAIATRRSPPTIATTPTTGQQRHGDRLVEWTASDGWGPLCAALRASVPTDPFPHANTTDEFKARVASGVLGPRAGH